MDPATNSQDPESPPVNKHKPETKRFINTCVDKSPTSENSPARIVRQNLAAMNTPERSNVKLGLRHQARTLNAIAKEGGRKAKNMSRSLLRLTHIAYLDEAWGGRQSWTPPSMMPDVDSLGTNIISYLHSITQLAVANNIPLPSLWQEGGLLHSHATHGKVQLLSVDKASAALRQFKRQISGDGLQTLSEQNHPLDHEFNEYSDPDNASLPQSPRLSSSNVISSPFPENGRAALADPRQELADTSLQETGFDFHYDIGFGEDEALPSSANDQLQPLPNTPPIFLMDVDNIRDEEADVIGQSDLEEWGKAREILQDPEGRLTSGTLHLILQTIRKTSKSPNAMVMDPYWLEIDGWNKDLTPPHRFDKITSENYKVYIPMHVIEEHWTLAVFTRLKVRVEFYDSSKSCERARHVESAFRAIVNRALRPSTELSFTERPTPQQRNHVDCGLIVAEVLACLLNDRRAWRATITDSKDLRLGLVAMLEANRPQTQYNSISKPKLEPELPPAFSKAQYVPSGQTPGLDGNDPMVLHTINSAWLQANAVEHPGRQIAALERRQRQLTTAYRIRLQRDQLLEILAEAEPSDVQDWQHNIDDIARLLAQSAHNFPAGQITEEAIWRIDLELNRLRRQAKEAKLLAEFGGIMEQWADFYGEEE